MRDRGESPDGLWMPDTAYCNRIIVSCDNPPFPARRRIAPANQPPKFGVARAGQQVIVHHAGRLHVGVHHGRSDETEAAPLEFLRQCFRFAA
jgi:hypothetical protein